MKVLWITSHGDTLNSIRPEAGIALGLARAGVEMHVTTQADSPYAEPMRQAGIRHVPLVPRKKFDGAAAKTIRAYCVEHGIEVLHLFSNKAIGTGLVAARGLPVKVVTHRGRTGNVRRWDPVARLTHLNPRIDRVVCVSEATARAIGEAIARLLANPEERSEMGRKARERIAPHFNVADTIRRHLELYTESLAS